MTDATMLAREALDFQPQLVAEEFGPEPSLREIVQNYYRTHIGGEEGRALAQRYLAALSTAPGERVALREAVERVILRRLHKNRIDGYTLEMAEEIAALSAAPGESEGARECDLCGGHCAGTEPGCPRWDASTPPAAPAAAPAGEAGVREAIKAAISDYHYALDCRENGNTAQHRAFDRICSIMGMHWQQGVEKAKRAALAQETSNG